MIKIGTTTVNMPSGISEVYVGDELVWPIKDHDLIIFISNQTHILNQIYPGRRGNIIYRNEYSSLINDRTLKISKDWFEAYKVIGRKFECDKKNVKVK